MPQQGPELWVFEGCASDETGKPCWCVFLNMLCLSHLHVPLLTEKLKHFAVFLALPQPPRRIQIKVGGCSLCLFIISLTAAPPQLLRKEEKAKRGCASCDTAIIISP